MNDRIKQWIRPYRASGRFDDDDLLAEIFAGPLANLESESDLLVDTGGRVSGYLVAAADTRSCVTRYRQDRLPGFSPRRIGWIRR